MASSSLDTVKRVNATLRRLLDQTRACLRGEHVFGVDEIRQLQQPIQEMEPIVNGVEPAKRNELALGEHLDEYKCHIKELQTTLEQIRIMLLARHASLQASRSQLATIHQWFEAFQQTR